MNFQSVKRQKNCKAPGISGIFTELLKIGGGNMAPNTIQCNTRLGNPPERLAHRSDHTTVEEKRFQEGVQEL